MPVAPMWGLAGLGRGRARFTEIRYAMAAG
jgi:hypothetical protein